MFDVIEMTWVLVGTLTIGCLGVFLSFRIAQFFVDALNLFIAGFRQ